MAKNDYFELDDLDDELLQCIICKKFVEMFDRPGVCYDCNRGDI
tara:strand:+ start:202 stop:333 length:132 start_codon:yes stop_codon:yes gene_type:complete